MSLSYYYSERDKFKGYVSYHGGIKHKYVENQKRYKMLKASLATIIKNTNSLKTNTSAVIDKMVSAVITGGKGFGEEDLTQQLENLGMIVSYVERICMYCDTQIKKIQESIDGEQEIIVTYQNKVNYYQALINAEEASSKARGTSLSERNYTLD